MQKEYLLWGLAKGETRDYMEALLLTTTDSALIEKAKELASADGWHSFRVSIFNGEAPDFTKILNT